MLVGHVITLRSPLFVILVLCAVVGTWYVSMWVGFLLPSGASPSPPLWCWLGAVGRASIGGIKGACPAPLINPSQHQLIGGGVSGRCLCQPTQLLELRSRGKDA